MDFLDAFYAVLYSLFPKLRLTAAFIFKPSVKKSNYVTKKQSVTSHGLNAEIPVEFCINLSCILLNILISVLSTVDNVDDASY